MQHLAWSSNGAIWATAENHVLRVQNPLSDGPDVTRFDDANGLPVSSDMRVFTLSDTVYVSTKNGLYRYIHADASSRKSAVFVPDTTLDPNWAKEGAYVTHLIATDDGSVWGRAIESSPNGQRVITSLYQGPAGRLHNSRPLVPFRDQVRGPFYIEDRVVWIGDRGVSPLSRLDFTGILATSATGPAAQTTGGAAREAPLIQQVSTVSPRSTVFGEASPGQTIRVPGGHAGVEIQFAFPRFALVASPVEFRTRLNDTDPWTPWSREASATYANLPDGKHRFEVQARLPGEAATAITKLTLHIVPAWYWTSWALVLWALLGLAVLGGTVYGGIRWRTHVLQQRQNRLQSTIRDRTQQVERQNEQLADQASRLRRMDRVKSEFFADVSHEFRTPLTLIIGPLEDLLGDENSYLSPDARQNMMFALRNSRRLLRLIGQLLDTAKLETGNLTLRTQPLNLVKFVGGLSRSFMPLAERSRVQMAVDAPTRIIVVRADPEKLEKMIGNLLSNALKFTPEDGRIQVTVSTDEDGDEAVVRVKDSGPGVRLNDPSKVFDRFYQADASGRQAQPGTGIGLSLTKNLTELHGGTIAVENAADTGAIFTLRLPIADVPASASPSNIPQHPTSLYAGLASTDTEVVSTSQHSAGDGLRSEAPQSLPAARPVSKPSDAQNQSDPDERTTILIADDNDEIRAYVRSHFEPDYRILEAQNGSEAIQMARTYLPDLVISDVMMPDVDGFDVVRALRSKPETDFLPVILLTARAAEEDRIAGLDEGTDAYLTKPFSLRALHSRVENLIASRRRLKERFASASAGTSGAPSKRERHFEENRDLSPAGRAYVKHARQAVLSQLGNEEFGVEDLADALSQSRSTVYRRLRDHLGQSPSAFIREIRLQQGARLLRNDEGTVSEIAYAVGFKSVSYFSKSFGDHYGVVPSAYADTISQE